MTSIRRFIGDFFSLFYPRLCSSCNKALISSEECICSFCRFGLPYTHLHKDRENPITAIFWGRAQIETATALFYFQKGGKVQHLIHRFKYMGKVEIGFFLGKMFGSQLIDQPLWDPVDLIVPVPLHAHKQHKRGFNQSEIFGRGISETFHKPLEINNLVRVTKTDSQTRKSRFKRWENVETVFRVNKPELLKGKNILLIDDVVTTGSTLEACIHKLREIKGTRIWVATIAMSV
jgi:ComF family protein